MSGKANPTKKRRGDNDDGNGNNDKNATIEALRAQIATLQAQVVQCRDNNTTYYASSLPQALDGAAHDIPQLGMAADHVKEMIVQQHELDFKPRLNTSSYVNVVSEEQERQVALLGLEVNLADASVYPASMDIHDQVVAAIARLWHAPCPNAAAAGANNSNHVSASDYSGAGTVGSTEACLLAGLAHKFRWRKWYASQHPDLTPEQITGIKPNIVISTCYQAAWEKFFRYFDMEPNFVKPSLLSESKGAMDAKTMAEQINEKTIAVVGILGNHYNGVYDPIWDMDKEIRRVNQEKGYQVGIHVDAASGGFVAPFQINGTTVPPFDFRLETVLSMSASGHKFGESVCGTGWVVFRQRKDLAEHIAVSVSYLGGCCDSMTLNFSRPASGPYVQMYKFLRLGKEGYTSKVQNQMATAAYIRNFLRELKHPSGKPRFQMLDGGEKAEQCLPVVAARLNPDLHLHYDDIDFQHALSETHWYVSGYCLSFENFKNGGKEEPLFADLPEEATMFRIVVKSNLTLGLAQQLMRHLEEMLPQMDAMETGYSSLHSNKEKEKELTRKKSMETEMNTAVAAAMWLGKARARTAARMGSAADKRAARRRSTVAKHATC